MLLNFFTNGRLNVSILKIGKKFKTASFNKKFIGFSNQNKISVAVAYLISS